MRPKNLKFPFTWEQRQPIFYEGVFIVPKHYAKHDQWVDSEDLFSAKQSVSIEFCSGNGDWVIEKAKNQPSKYWIAVEMQFERVRKVWSKMRNFQVNNLLLVCGEALTFARHYLLNLSVEEVFVNFPDPWPKPRHAKHRLIQSPFVTELSRVVKKGGTTTLVTDDASYCQHMIATMQKANDWDNIYPEPFYITEWESYGTSWFQSLWKNKGRQSYYIQYKKI